MKATWNAIGISLAVGACAALLSACDGRGTTPFKPVSYSNDELGMHKQDFDKAAGTGAVAGNTPIKMTNGTVDPKKVSATTTTTVDGKVVTAPVNPGGALAKVFIDRDSNSGIVSALITEVDGLTNTGDAAGSAVVQGIDLHVVGSSDAPKLFIDAQILFKGQKLNLYVKDYALTMGTDGKVAALPITLQDSNSIKDVSAENKNDIVGYAFCRESCQTVYVLLAFNDSAAVEAAIILQEGQIVRSNLSVGDAPVKCFAAALDPKQTCDGQIVPASTTLAKSNRYLKMVSKIARANSAGTTTVAQTPAVVTTPSPLPALTVANRYLKKVAKLNHAKPIAVKVAEDKAVGPIEKSVEKLVAPKPFDKAPTPKKKGYARKNLAPTVQDAAKDSNHII